MITCALQFDRRGRIFFLTGLPDSINANILNYCKGSLHVKPIFHTQPNALIGVYFLVWGPRFPFDPPVVCKIQLRNFLQDLED